jgi:hypothetical protein
MKSIRLSIIALALLAISSIATAEEPVVVRKSPASLSVRSFDPKRPPKEMPPLNASEAAVTETVFACGARVEVETKSVDEKPVRTKIVGVRLELGLEVTEWLPKETTAKIKAHEDGHRKISELYYENAEKIAGDIARKYVGKQLEFADGDGKAAIKKAAGECCQEYLAAMEKPSQKVQEKYDVLTDHGRNKVAEKRAIEKAIEESKKDATTRRATESRQ